MRKMSVILTSIALLAFTNISFAAIELKGSLPASSGQVYKMVIHDELVLKPVAQKPTPCTAGTIYLNGTTGKVDICDGNGWGQNLWRREGNNIFPISYADTAINLVLGTSNLGILKFTMTDDGGIFSKGTYGSGRQLTDIGAGVKFITYSRKAAFRFVHLTGYGAKNGDEANDNWIGNWSIAMGRDAYAPADAATVTGGANNQATGILSFVGGGSNNVASSPGVSTVVAGTSNEATGLGSTVVGGMGNNALFAYDFIGGGLNNEASGGNSAVTGGWLNVAQGGASTIGGGENNTVTGWYSSIPGGLNNRVDSNYGLAFGANMRLTNTAHNSVVFGVANSQVSVSAPDAFVISPNNTTSVVIGRVAPTSGYKLDVNGKIGGNLDGSNNTGELKVRYGGSGATAGYYAVYAP